MFGIDLCDVHKVWNAGIISSFLQMSSRLNPKSLFVIEINHDILVLPCLPKIKISECKEHGRQVSYISS